MVSAGALRGDGGAAAVASATPGAAGAPPFKGAADEADTPTGGISLSRRTSSGGELLSRAPSASASSSSSSSAVRRSHRSYRDLWLRFAAASSAGRRADGAPKVNQDTYLVKTRLRGLRYAHLFAVFDGHGHAGHEASDFLREHIAAAVEEELGTLPQDSMLYRGRCRLSRASRHEELQRLARALKHAVGRVEAALFAQGRDRPAPGAPHQRFYLSGTTAVLLLLIGRHCVVANVGDSRCVLLSSPDQEALAPEERTATGWPAWATLPKHVRCRTAPPSEAAGEPAAAAAMTRHDSPHPQTDPGVATSPLASGRQLDSRASSSGTAESVWTAGSATSSDSARVTPEPAADTVRLTQRALTEDQKPDSEGERRRVERCGGAVRQLWDSAAGAGVGPARVWARETGHRGPGLAMSRSVSDGLAASCGVVSDPVVTYHYLRPRADHFLVLGSDGLFEFLQPEDVVAAVRDAPEVTDAAVALCRAAQFGWVRAMSAAGSLAIDDITALVLALWPGAYPTPD